MKERYNATGDARMTDEFMKPIIVDNNGLIQSKAYTTSYSIGQAIIINNI